MLKCRRSFAFMVLVFLLAGRAAAATYLVRDGQPNAQIVVSKDDQRPRMAKLAAEELQTYIRKMSGAELPIVTEPGGAEVLVLVGESPRARRHGVDAEGLAHGAFRMVAGDG